MKIAAWWWCEYWEKLPYYNSNCTKVRDKLVRESYKTSMGPLTLCHFCITPIYTYTMVEEILENPQLDFWWFLVRCSSWRRLNLWPWNISSLCCWYSVHFVLCEVWRWCTIENRFIKKSLGSADAWLGKIAYTGVVILFSSYLSTGAPINTTMKGNFCIHKGAFYSIHR